jgi:predicted nuclease of predicted toxin-antitoxin system
VLAVSELSPGVDDPTVLARAESDRRILITNDKDFASLAFLQGQVSAGIVLVRLGSLRSAVKATRLVEVARDIGTALENVMTVVEAESVRRRSFPPSGGSPPAAPSA